VIIQKKTLHPVPLMIPEAPVNGRENDFHGSDVNRIDSGLSFLKNEP
jgi:hypothetical protein